MSDIPKSVHINEEGPREGFQIEAGTIPTARKIELIDALSETGLKHMQIVSFVNPQRVPGMADSEQVVKGLTLKSGVDYTGLWLNEKGLERAIATGRLKIEGRVALCASEKFLKRNNNKSFAEQEAYNHRVLGMYKEIDVPIRRGSIMAWATPQSVKRVVGAIRERYPDLRLSLHLHDTRGMAVANAYAGLEMGVDMYDASVAGLGGCPFAGHKSAAGNVCTEDLVFMCDEMGIDTGIDLDKLLECARLAEDIVGHPLPGSVMRGGSLNKLRAALQ